MLPTHAGLVQELHEALHAMLSLTGRKAFDSIMDVAEILFKIIDWHKTGFIDHMEFADFSRCVAEQCSIWSRGAADFSAMDTSGDRRIDVSELHAYLRATFRAVGKRQFVAQMSMVGELLRTGDEDDSTFADLRAGPGCVIPQTCDRGILVSQLRAVFGHIKRRCKHEAWHDQNSQSPKFGAALKPHTVNLYHTTEYVIKPATSQRRCSYVEWVAQEAQPPRWFVSHYWGEPVKDFIACLAQHQKDRELSASTPYWVCAYANNQWDLNAELCEDPAKTSFRRAMQKSEGTVSVLDSAAVSFTRVWCCYEIWVSIVERRRDDFRYDMYTATKRGGVGITDGCAEADQRHEFPVDAKRKREMVFPIELCRQGVSIRLQDAEASRELDRRCILNSIVGHRRLDAPPLAEHARYDELNRTLRGLVATATWRDALENGEPLDKYTEALAACDLPRLEVSFDSSSLITDAGMGLLLGTVTEGLEDLNLDLSFCAAITDQTLLFLATAMAIPKTLRRLTLSFMVVASRPSPLTDSGLATLARALPKTVQLVDLNLHGCKTVSDAGIEALIDNLPEKLEAFSLDVAFNGNISSAVPFKLAERLGGLNSIKLNLHYCTNALTDDALLALCGGVRATLLTLSLDLRYAENLSSESVRRMFTGIFREAPALRDLNLNLNWCKRLTDEALPIVLPNSLRTLSLGFGWCRLLTDAALTKIARCLPKTLQELNLQLNDCVKCVTPAAISTLAGSLPRDFHRLELWLMGCPGATSAKEIIEKALEDHAGTEILIHS